MLFFTGVITAVEIGVLAKKCYKEKNWKGFKEMSAIKIISSVVCIGGGAAGSALGGSYGIGNYNSTWCWYCCWIDFGNDLRWYGML